MSSCVGVGRHVFLVKLLLFAVNFCLLFVFLYQDFYEPLVYCIYLTIISVTDWKVFVGLN